jgi:glycosyltransferase involved in cell wall biosynthesis
MNLTVAIIARDEARHIAGCLASVAGLADDVLVLLDDRTSDATGAISREHGARVVCEPWRGFPAQRNRALELARGEWVLFLDADERVTPELRTELTALLGGAAAAAGYRIPRYNLFFGRVVRGGGWYPDHQLRLLRRTCARYNEARLVHEFAELNGPVAVLHAHLLHHNIERLDEFWLKQTRYALAEARTLHREGRRARWRNFVGAPAREFVRRFLRLGGWRDGALGLFLCAALAWFEVVKFGMLRLIGGAPRDPATGRGHPRRAGSRDQPDDRLAP